MPLIHSRHILHFFQQLKMQLPLFFLLRHNSQITASFLQISQDFPCRSALRIHQKLPVPFLLLNLPDPARHLILHHIHITQSQPVFVLFLLPVRFQPEPFRIGQYLPGIGQQPAACRCQFEPSSPAGEQFQSQLFLQILQRHTEAGLGNVKHTGRPAHRSCLANRIKILQLQQCHGFPLQNNISF